MKQERQNAPLLKTRNQILSRLAPQVLEAIRPFATETQLCSGDVLFEPDCSVEHVYFPNTAVLSVVTVMQDGRCVECDTVGFESAVGLLEALSGARTVGRTFAQIPGTAVGIRASSLKDRAESIPALRSMLLRHAQANLAQAHQSVACNALHSVQQRLCRWLLASHDRTGNDVIRLTQQYLATMVGVQRTTITQALRELAKAGAIRQGHAHVQVLNRRGLELRACECNTTLQSTLERLLGESALRR